MKIRLQNGLPYVSAVLVHREQQLVLANVLIDTGSAGTIMSTDKLLPLGLKYAADDPVHRIRGIGGVEFVFVKQIEALSSGELLVRDFEIEIGTLDYGVEMDGIIGMDFLTRVGAILDLARLEVHP